MDCVNSLGTEGHGFLHSSGLCRELRAANKPNQGPTTDSKSVAFEAISCSIGDGDKAEDCHADGRWEFLCFEILFLPLVLWKLYISWPSVVVQEERPDGLLAKHAYSVLQADEKENNTNTGRKFQIKVGLKSRSYVPLANDWWRRSAH